jgi:hypothetical protein
VLLGTLWASPVLAQGRHILFDLSHGEARFSDPYDYQSVSGWGPAMDRLVAAGFTWSVIPEGATITPQALSSGCFLIVAEPLLSFSPDEVTAVLEFVRNGGGLLLANDFNAPVNDIATPTGVTFLLGPSSGFTTVTEIVPGHPVTEGVSQIDWPIGTPLLVGSSATPLAYLLGQPVMAYQEYGEGRILYIGDNELFSNYGINDPDNAVLLLNVTEWLCFDADGDEIRNDEDLCPGTAPGEPVDVNGCSYDQRQEAACPLDKCYRNHGEYVVCVVRAAHQAVEDGLISRQEAKEAIWAAVHSDVGKNGNSCSTDDDDDDGDKPRKRRCRRR